MRVEILHPDTLHEECGVFGILDHPQAVGNTALGLHALQHRGQEAAGIAAVDGAGFTLLKARGLVSEVYNAKTQHTVQGTAAIGHVRYSTAGGNTEANIQPFMVHTQLGQVALAHNGNLTNADALRHTLMAEGQSFQSTSDTEVIVHLLAQSQKPTVQERLVDALGYLKGAYSLVVLTADTLMGVRDPAGVRPLVIGMLDGSYVLASETCALDMLGADFVRDVKPGELVTITEAGLTSQQLPNPEPNRFCVFEYIYFMRPNSRFGGKYVSHVRESIGAELFRESHVPADVVIPVPDSGIHAAVGYAETAGIPFKQGLVRSHYVGRTFIEPTSDTRHAGVRLKLSVNAANVMGRRVVLIDDSIVRGTTMPKIVDMLRRAGALEVHVRISSPPFAHPCFYGIDTPDKSQLTAANHSLEEIRAFTGADSLAYISLDGLYKAVAASARNTPKREFCDACFSGEYPIELTDLNKENQNIKKAS
ncbi:MAG: amidophosphoribosyltransferase [Proteobacteria bacterium]|nr:amidophosphoribosyltransferase [Pseudomonadota bacterium]